MSQGRGLTVAKESASRQIATNRKARFDYTIEETYEAGIVLTGTEVKSLRLGKATLRDSFARIDRNEVWVHNLHISPYEHGNRWNHEPTRQRKALMHRAEIRRLIGKIQQQGYTLVPLSLYFNKRGIAKIQLGLAKGKKKWDKRETMARRSAEREAQRALKERSFQ